VNAAVTFEFGTHDVTPNQLKGPGDNNAEIPPIFPQDPFFTIEIAR